MRKYHISACIVLQSLGQIKDKYEKLWESMIGNCDVFLYLGSSENETNKYVSEKLGKTTIRTANMSESKGRSGSTSMSFQHTARDLMDPAEVGKLDNRECLVMIRGIDPIKTRKYDFTKHPHFKETGTCSHDLRVSAQYMDEHFKCLPKDTIKKEKVTNTEQKSKNALTKQQNPAGGGQNLGTRPAPIPNVKTFEKVANTKATSKGFTGMRSVDPKEYDRHALEHAGDQKERIPDRMPKNIMDMKEDGPKKPAVKPEAAKTDVKAGSINVASLVNDAEKNISTPEPEEKKPEEKKTSSTSASPAPGPGPDIDDVPFEDPSDFSDNGGFEDDDLPF